jgi:hypothetical protein
VLREEIRAESHERIALGFDRENDRDRAVEAAPDILTPLERMLVVPLFLKMWFRRLG